MCTKLNVDNINIQVWIVGEMRVKVQVMKSVENLTGDKENIKC